MSTRQKQFSFDPETPQDIVQSNAESKRLRDFRALKTNGYKNNLDWTKICDGAIKVNKILYDVSY